MFLTACFDASGSLSNVNTTMLEAFETIHTSFVRIINMNYSLRILRRYSSVDQASIAFVSELRQISS